MENQGSGCYRCTDKSKLVFLILIIIMSLVGIILGAVSVTKEESENYNGMIKTIWNIFHLVFVLGLVVGLL